MASGPRSALTWMERCLLSRDFDVGIESSEASKSAVSLHSVDHEIIRDLCFNGDDIHDYSGAGTAAAVTANSISLSAPGFKDKEGPVDATASKVGSVFGEINVAQPFHYPEKKMKLMLTI